MASGESSRIDVHGGELSGLLDANDTSTLRLFGSGFNIPDGPVSATSGTLADGTPLDVSFEREPTASIVVPEPAAHALGLAGAG